VALYKLMACYQPTTVSGGGLLPAYGKPRDIILPYSLQKVADSQLLGVSPGGVGVLSELRRELPADAFLEGVLEVRQLLQEASVGTDWAVGTYCFHCPGGAHVVLHHEVGSHTGGRP